MNRLRINWRSCSLLFLYFASVIYATMSGQHWDKCVAVIHQLSSRIANDNNLSIMMASTETTVPPCIETSFYQCQSNLGRTRCVRACTEGRSCETSCLDQPCTNAPMEMDVRVSQNQLALSKMFDNKRKYIDYIVSNVLRQVVHQVSIDSLHQLSCLLPQTIDQMLRHVTDIDSDRLVRILVTEVLQCYGTNAGQVFDWYAFASSMKLQLPSTKEKDEVPVTAMNTSSKTKQRSGKKKNSSQREMNTHLGSTFSGTPISTFTNREPIVRSPTGSKGQTLEPKAITKELTPTRSNSKETFTPLGSQYQSRLKSTESSVEKNRSHDANTPMEKSFLHRSRKKQSERVSSDTHRPSTTSHDRSLNSECILTIHHTHGGHKHPHRTGYDYYRQHNHYSTTSFESPFSDDDSENTFTWSHLSSRSADSSESQQPMTIQPFFMQSAANLDLPRSLSGTGTPIPVKEKLLRINHYPNMLADFD